MSLKRNRKFENWIKKIENSNNTDTTIQQVATTKAQLLESASLLARSFMQDPLVTYFIPDQEKRRRILQLFIRVWFEVSKDKCITVMCSDKTGHAKGVIKSVSSWYPPGKAFSTLDGLSIVRKGIGSVDTRTALKWLKWATKIQKLHDKIMKDQPDHYYLFIVGTEPCATGKGFGTKVMRPILDIADKEKKSCYLESSNQRNLTFYKRLGFKVIMEETVFDDAPTVYLMRRDPNTLETK